MVQACLAAVGWHVHKVAEEGQLKVEDREVYGVVVVLGK